MANVASDKGRKESAALTHTTRDKTSAVLSYTQAPPYAATWRGVSLLPEEGAKHTRIL